MKKTQGFRLDHVGKAIFTTKAFLKRAGIFRSPEYETVVKLLKDFPEYELLYNTVKKHEKNIKD